MTLKPFVHALVVTDGLTPYVERTLESLHEQTLAPQRVTVADISATTTPELSELCRGRDWEYSRVGPVPNFGSAVTAAIASDSDSSSEGQSQWLWLLHDDSYPHPDCLQAIVSKLATVKTVGVIGCKQRSTQDNDRLLELGVKATRTGRRYDHMRGELDQGQYDHTEDVLAVSTAGMCVSRSLWTQMEGTDPHLVNFGESLEFGRRVHLAGWRVIVEPKAVVFHEQAAYSGQRHDLEEPTPAYSFGQRRAAQMYNWALAAPAWHLPFLFVLFPILQVLRSLFRLASRNLRLVWQELKACFLIMGSSSAIFRGRLRLSRVAKLKPRDIKRLQTSPLMLFKYRWIDRRARRAAQPVEMLEPVASAGVRVRKERSYFGFSVVVLVSFIASLIFWSPRLSGMVGSAALTLPNDWSSLWQYAWTAWIPQGLGAEAPADPILAVLSLIFAPAGLFGISMPTALRILLFLSPMISAIGAWFAAGTFTRAVPLRMWAALVWISLPAYWISAAQGRVSVICFAMAAPYVVWGFMRGGLLHKPEIVTSAAGDLVVRSVTQRTRFLAISSFALLVVVSAQPMLLLPAWLMAGLGVAVFPSRKFSALLLPIPASVQVFPFIWYAYRHEALQALLGSIDSPVVFTLPSSLQLLLGWPMDWHDSGLPLPWWVFSIPFFCAVILAVIASWRSGRRGWITKGIWVLVLGLLVVSTVVRNIAVAALDQIINAWTGILLLSIAALIIMLVCIGFDRTWVTRPRSALMWAPTALVSTAVAAAIISVFVAPVGYAYAYQDLSTATVAGTHYAVPASAEQASNSDRRARVLVLEATDNGGLHARIWRHDGATYVEHNALLDVLDAHLRTTDKAPDLADSLSNELARLRAGQQTKQLAKVLANHAIEQVVLTEWKSRAGNNLKSQLQFSPGLESIGPTEAGLTWRVAAPSISTDAGAIALRVYIDGDKNQRQMVPSGVLSVDTDISNSQGVLTLVENPSSGWRAHLDGRQLQPKSGELQQFTLTGGKHLEVTWSRPWLFWWRTVCVVSYIVLFSALLFSYRRRQNVLAK